MLYPPKKRAYSPENKKTKELSNLMNINSKFTGSGGSIFNSKQIPLRLHPRNHCQCPSHQSQAFSSRTSTQIINLEDLVSPHSLENITSEEISQLLSISKEHFEK